MSDSPFRIIPGGQPDKPKRTRSLVPWECRACEAELGIKTRALVKVRQGAKQDEKLNITGGRDIWVCAVCLTRGKITPVTA